MADNIVGNLFGIDMQSMQAALDAKAQAENYKLAQLDPYQAQRYYAAEAGRGIGKGINTLFGLEDPMLAKQRKENEVLQQVQGSLSPEDLQDPVKLSQAVFTAAQQAGLNDLANHAYQGLQQSRLQNAKVGKEVAETQKAQMDVALKQQDYMQQAKAQEAISTLWKAKQAVGETPTNEEIISVAAQFMPADKLATLMQTSADKEAYRKVMIDQVRIATEAKADAAEKAGATAIELERIRQEGRIQLATLAAALKGSGDNNKPLSGREARYADNVAIGANEAIGGINTIINLPKNVTGGFWGAGLPKMQSGSGLFEAPIGALKNSMTPEVVQRYNTEISNLGKNFSVMRNGGLASSNDDVNKFEMQYRVNEGDKPLTAITKLAQMRQFFERVAEIKIKSKATPPEQLDNWKSWLQQVQEAIPLTVNDVNAIANSKDKTQTFKQALDELAGKKGSNSSSSNTKVVNGVTYVNDGKGWKKQ